MPKKKGNAKKTSFIASDLKGAGGGAQGGGAQAQGTRQHGGYNPFDSFASALENPLLVPSSKRPLYREDIFAVSPLLSEDECEACVAAAEQRGFEAATQFASKTHAFRDNDRLECVHPRLAEALWRRVCSFVPPEIDGRAAVGCNPRIRVYRYRVGQQFSAHIDGSVAEADGSHSAHTMLVYLNGGGADELRGGETVFYKGTGKKQKEALRVTPLRGLCLLHGHGHRCLLHAGAEVKRGVKYLLRTDVMYR